MHSATPKTPGVPADDLKLYRSIVQPYEDPAIVTHVVRQILPDRHPLTLERVWEGQSTAVYRVYRDATIYYFRVLPELNASFGPEAYVHSTLRAWGLHVPDSLYFEPYNATLERSIMLTTAITGQPVGSGPRPAQVAQIVRCAGRELARINTLPVQRFGWVNRTTELKDNLYGEYSTYQEWLNQDFDPPLQVLQQSNLFSARDHQAIRELMAEAVILFGAKPAVLAHGDFDGTHIYHQKGQYTGIIDFGEIRGAHRLYDIGHFWIEYSDLLPSLLEGYAEVAALPPDYQRHIHLTALLIAARRLGRSLAKQAGVFKPDVQTIQNTLRVLNA